jgi:hypothetical protein
VNREGETRRRAATRTGQGKRDGRRRPWGLLHGGGWSAGSRISNSQPSGRRRVSREGRTGRSRRFLREGRGCRGDASRGEQRRTAAMGGAAEDDGHGSAAGGGRWPTARGGGGPGARGGAREWERRELCWSLREQMRETGLNPNFLCTCSLKLRGF